MKKQDIDQETAELQQTVRLLMSTVVLAALIVRRDPKYIDVTSEALELTDALIEKAGGLHL